MEHEGAGLEQGSVLEGGRATERTSDHKRRWLFLGAASVVIVLDQVTKTLVRTFLDRGDSWPDADWEVKLRHLTNTGAAFGILQNQTTFLIVMAFVGLIAIYLYYRFPPFEHPVVPLAIGLMLGGACGNLIDRIVLGRVTDFVDFPRFPAFNVADASINIGIGVIIVGYLLIGRNQNAPPSPDE